MHIILRIAGPQQFNAEIVAEIFLRGTERTLSVFGAADPRHHAEALRFDEDLSFLIQAAAHRLLEGIVRAAEPFAVPAVRKDRGFHLIRFLPHRLCFFSEAGPYAEFSIFLRVFHEHRRDEDAFRLPALEVRTGLEVLAGLPAEAVQVQTVIPVGAADERQAVRAAVQSGISHAPAKMLHQRDFRALFIIEGRRFIQDRHVAGLAHVCCGAGDEPQRIVIEARTDVGISALGQRLVLVIGAAVGKLDRRDVQDPLPRAFRNEMHEAEQILAAVAEAHASSGPALVVGRAAAHVEGDHALILVPDVDHAVKFFLAAP